MVAMKKSLTLAAFAVAGVNADGCCSSLNFCHTVNQIHAEPGAKIHAGTSAPGAYTCHEKLSAGAGASAPGTEEPDAADESAATAVSADGEEADAEDAEVTNNAKTFVGAQGEKLRNSAATAMTKFENARQSLAKGSTAAFRQANQKRKQVMEKVTALAAENTKIARAAAALSALSVLGLAGEKFCPANMTAARAAIISAATESAATIANHTPEQVQTLLQEFASKTNAMKDGCVSFCSTQSGNMYTGLTDAVSALCESKAVNAVKDFGADAQAFGSKHVAVPVKSGAGRVAKYAVHVKDTALSFFGKGEVVEIEKTQFEKLKAEGTKAINKFMEGMKAIKFSKE